MIQYFVILKNILHVFCRANNRFTKHAITELAHKSLLWSMFGLRERKLHLSTQKHRHGARLHWLFIELTATSNMGQPLQFKIFACVPSAYIAYDSLTAYSTFVMDFLLPWNLEVHRKQTYRGEDYILHIT